MTETRNTRMMPPVEVRFRPAARRDLDQILRFVRRHGADANVARRFVGQIADRCIALGHTPHIGRLQERFAPGLRMIAFDRKTVVAYVALNDRVEIVHILHGGRDIEAFFRRILPG